MSKKMVESRIKNFEDYICKNSGCSLTTMTNALLFGFKNAPFKTFNRAIKEANKIIQIIEKQSSKYIIIKSSKINPIDEIHNCLIYYIIKR